MPRVRTLWACALLPGALALLPQPLRCNRPRPLLTRCSQPRLLGDAEDIAVEKRLRADRLALEAERAALEAERLTLQAEELKLALLKRRGPEAIAAEAAAKAKQAAEAEAAAAAAAAAASNEAAAESTATLFNATLTDEMIAERLDGAFNNGTEAAMMSELGRSLLNMVKQQEELQLDDDQVAAMRSDVFDLQNFYVTDVQKSPFGTIFRGNLRSDPDKVFSRVEERLLACDSLKKVRILFLEDPIPLTLQQIQDGEEKRPVFLAIGKEVGTKGQTAAELLAAVGLLLLSSLTSLGYALSAYLLAPNENLIEKMSNGDPEPLMQALPIAAGLAGLTLVHELAHYVQARRLGIKTGVPLVLPSLQLGLFGCITRILDFPRSRKDLFDFSIAGPAAGGIASLLLYLVGLAISPGAVSSTPSNPVLPVAFLDTSLLLGTIAQLLLPDGGAATVELHPLAVIGFTGALVNALQLLPIGRLDGGRVSTALFGPGAGLVSGLSLLVLGFSTVLFGDNPVLLFFSLVVILFQRSAELPATNEISGIEDDTRKLAALAAFAFCVLTVVPFPAPDPSSLGF